MKSVIINKPLFVVFLILDIIVVGAATWANCTKGLNVLLSVLAVFAPLPMLWQTEINESYKPKTKAGKYLMNESGGIGVMLVLHICLLILLWVMGSFAHNTEDGEIALFVTGVILVMVIFAVVVTRYVDGTAKKYSMLSSEELFVKTQKGTNLASGGLSVIVTGFVLGFAVLLVQIVLGVGSEALNLFSSKPYHFIEEHLLFPLLIYGMAVTSLLGLTIFCIGWTKRGIVARSLNMYVKHRKLEPWEIAFVRNQSAIEESAQQIRTQQIIGQAVPGGIGDAIELDAATKAVPMLKSATSKGSTKWYVLATIIGFIIVGIAPLITSA